MWHIKICEIWASHSGLLKIQVFWHVTPCQMVNSPSQVHVQKDMGIVSSHGRKEWQNDNVGGRPTGLVTDSPSIVIHCPCCSYLNNVYTSFHATSLPRFLDPEDEDNRILWNTGNYLPVTWCNILEDSNLKQKSVQINRSYKKCFYIYKWMQ
jgi:hypothetical protein